MVLRLGYLLHSTSNEINDLRISIYILFVGIVLLCFLGSLQYTMVFWQIFLLFKVELKLGCLLFWVRKQPQITGILLKCFSTVYKGKILAFLLRQMCSHFDAFLNSIALTFASNCLTAIIEIFSYCSLNLIHVKSFIRINFQHVFQQLTKITRVYISHFLKERQKFPIIELFHRNLIAKSW